jgi:hypothetical protein
MIKEEWRLHQSLVGGFGSGLFPLIIFILTAIGAMITPYIMGNIELGKILLMLHIASVIYGIFVGGFGRIGEHVMTRRLGQVNVLLQLPQLYPVSFKWVMGIFYLKDAFFYLIYSYVPIVLGVGLAAPSVGVSYRGVGVLGVTMFLAFMIGMGLSFALSALSLKSSRRAFFLSCAILSLIFLAYPLEIIPIAYVIPPLGYWLTKNTVYIFVSIAQSTVLASTGIIMMKERFELRQRRYNESFLSAEAKLGLMGELRTLVVKEWLELLRSGSLFPAVTGFGGILLAIYFVSWLFQAGFGIPLNLNVVFFSGFIGFTGVMTYSLLTNIEHNEYLNVQPISVDMVMKAKLIIYFVLTSCVTVVYLLLIGYLKDQMSMVPMGIVIAASTNLFVMAVTAYLTGLWTNTMFFGAKTILKFTALVVPPLTIIEIASILIQVRPSLATNVIYGVSMILAMVAALIFRRMEKKWRGTNFSYVSTNV